MSPGRNTVLPASSNPEWHDGPASVGTVGNDPYGQTIADLELPDDYVSVLVGLKERVREARYPLRPVNTELIQLNWQIGRILADQTDRAHWGDKVIERLATDPRSEFAGVTGLSVRNLKHMRTFARTWPNLGNDHTGGSHAGQNRATGCCPIALGTHHGAARQAHRSGSTRLVRIPGRSPRMESRSQEHHIKTTARQR